MATEPRDHQGTSLLRREGLEEPYVKVENVDAITTDILLQCCMVVFVIYVFKKERYESEKMKKIKEEEEKIKREDEKWKEYRIKVDHLRKENGKLQKEIDEIRAQFRNAWQEAPLYPDWRKEFFQAVDVTLDPDTAHPALLVSGGGRRVSMGEKPQGVPENPLRFQSLPCVLGRQALAAGRCYWEVEVGVCSAWDLGVCRHDAMQKETAGFSLGDGFWALRLCKDEYWAVASAKTQLTVKERPVRVCVFLEYEDGRISFYNMTDKTHIHTFAQGAFAGPLRPFLRLWSSDSGHLAICPAPEAAQPEDAPHSTLAAGLATSTSCTLQIGEA